MAKFGSTAVWRACGRIAAAVGVLALLSTVVTVAPYSIDAQAAAVDTTPATESAAETAATDSATESAAETAATDSATESRQALDIVDAAEASVVPAAAAPRGLGRRAGVTTIRSPQTGGPAQNTNDSVPALDPTKPAADLSVSITPERDPILSESFISYAVTVTNNGPDEAVNVVVTNTLPSFMSFIALSGCWLANDTFPECHLNEIPAGGSRTYEVLALVGPGVIGEHAFAVAATSETAEPDWTNNTAQFVSTVNIRATWRDISATSDLSIAKIDLVDPVPALGTISYRVTVANAGPNAGVDVVVTETLPAGVTLVSTSGCRGPGVPVCSLGTIPPRQTRSFDVVVTADAGTVGDITNAVTVSSRSNDTNLANNTATETTTVNSAPVAVNDTASLPENAPATALDVLGNDTDFDNDPLTVTAIDGSGVTGLVSLVGSVVIYDPNGQFDTLAVGETATETFTYDISDGNGGTDTATVTVTITGVNDAPVAVGDDATVGEDGPPAVIDVVANDTDANGDSLTATAVDDTGTTGLVELTAGVVTYDPNGQFESLNTGDTATDTFGYTVDDGNGGSATATVTVTITGDNDAPTITSAASASIPENTAPALNVDSTDPEGDTDNGGGLVYSLSGADAALFSITPAGALAFLTPPDFEAPADAGADNDYDVTVTVTDSGTLTDTQDITITVTNSNEAPTIFAPIAGSTQENTTALTTISSSDPEGETDNGGGLVYSLTGPDAALFTITPAGVWSWITAPDFENPLDVGADNIYNLTFVVTDSGGLADTQDIPLTVTNVNEAPVITSDGGGDTASISIAENTTDITDVDATDPEGDTENGGGLVYALSGDDAGLLTLDPNTGALSFTTAPDFENPTDAGADNDYDVTVTVTDSGTLTDTQDITITVTNGNEPPTITSDGGGDTAAISIAENTTSVTDVDSSDADGETENGGGLVYALSGDDAGLFSITQAGALTFDTAPDFDSPSDTNGDNDYEVTVTVGDVGLLIDTQAITVTVTNINEAPVITGGATASTSYAENDTATVLDIDSTDPEGDTENGGGLTYALSGADALLFSITPSGELTFLARPDFENPTDAGGDNIYNVTVTVTDSGTLADTQDITITVSDQADPPVITSDGGGDTAALNAAENQTAVTDVNATDDEGATEGAGLTYGLSGPDASAFSISATGVLTFASPPDFETAGDANGDNDYEVTVTVTDPQTLTDAQEITVTVTNVNEGPTITAPATVSIGENTTGVADIDATDPDGETESGGGLVYSRGGPDGILFSIDAAGNLAFIAAPDFENPGDVGGDNVYNVTVSVTDLNGAGIASSQPIAITVADRADPPVITSDGGGDTAAVTVNQGTTAVTDVDATDDEGATEGGGGLTYGLSGADNALFAIDANGALSFVTAPTAAGVFTVIVTVTDPQTLTDSQTITVTVPANTAPTAVDDTYAVPVNVRLDAGTSTAGIDVNDADGVLTKGTDDSDPENNPLTVAGVVGCVDTSAPFTGCATTGGGTVTMNANGTFTYVSQAGETDATDSFQYTLSDGTLTDTGTVTITLGETIWFIDAAASPGGNGTSTAPFNTITAFNNTAADGAGDIIYVAGGTYTDAGFDLLADQKLIGASVGLTSGNLTIAPFGPAPTISSASGTFVVSLGANNTVRGFSSAGSAGSVSIRGDNFGSPVINDFTINGPGSLISLTNGNLTNVALGSMTSTSNGGVGMFLNSVTGTFNATAPVSTSGTSNEGIRIENSSATINFSSAVDITSSGSSAGLLLTSNTGTITFADLDVNNATPNLPGIVASGGGTLNITTGTVNSGSASAVDISGVSLGVTLSSVNSSGGTAPGIELRNTTGSFTANGGTIANKNGGDLAAGAKSGTGEGIGVYLDTASNVTLSGMTINGTMQNFGIRGFGLSGTTNFTNLTMNGTHGTTATSDEGTVALDEVTGTLNVTGGAYGGGHEDVFAVNNSSGTLNANVSGVTINASQAATGDNGLQITTSGSATLNLSVQNSNFNAAASVMLFVDVAGTGGGTVNIGGTTANTFTQGQLNASGGGAIEVLASGSGNTATLTTTIANNVIVAGSNTFEGDVIVAGTTTGRAGTHNLTVSGNIIGTSGVNGSATNSSAGSGDAGIVLTKNGNGTMNALVNNNSIYDFNSSGMEIYWDAEGSGNTGGTTNLSITNNTITDAAGGSSPSIDFIGQHAVTICVNITGNTLNQPGTSPRELRFDFFWPAGGGIVQVQGLGATLTEAAVEALWETNNTLAAGDAQAFILPDATIQSSAGCPQP